MYELDYSASAIAFRPALGPQNTKGFGQGDFALPRYDPGNGEDVSKGFLHYLKERDRDVCLRFSEGLVYIPNGWETYTYAFRLKTVDCLPSELRGPLVVRIYSSTQGLPRARHEFEVQQHLVKRGFPAPFPKFLEEDCTLFGGPFLVMEQVQGWTLVEFLSRTPLCEHRFGYGRSPIRWP